MFHKDFVKTMTCNELCFIKQKHSSKRDKPNKDIIRLSTKELKRKNCFPCD